MDGVAYWMVGHPLEFEALVEVLATKMKRVYEIAAAAPVEIIHSDENVTAVMEGPAPVRAVPSAFLRTLGASPARGRQALRHALDGSLWPIKDLVSVSPIDIVEAFTTPPMGDLGVADAKMRWPEKTIWTNSPGVIFLEE